MSIFFSSSFKWLIGLLIWSPSIGNCSSTKVTQRSFTIQRNTVTSWGKPWSQENIFSHLTYCHKYCANTHRTHTDQSQLGCLNTQSSAFICNACNNTIPVCLVSIPNVISELVVYRTVLSQLRLPIPPLPSSWSLSSSPLLSTLSSSCLLVSLLLVSRDNVVDAQQQDGRLEKEFNGGMLHIQTCT